MRALRQLSPRISVNLSRSLLPRTASSEVGRGLLKPNVYTVQTTAVSIDTHDCWMVGVLLLFSFRLALLQHFLASLMQTLPQTRPNERLALYSTSYVSRLDGKAQFVVFVKKNTDVDFAKVPLPMHGDISDLKDLIKTKLQISEPPNAIVLRKLRKGSPLSTLLDSRMTVEEAGLEDEDQLIVEAIGSSGTPCDWLLGIYSALSTA
jgi:hypothetical protein